MSKLIAVMLFVAVASPVFAEQPATPPSRSARFGALRPAQPRDPYRKLFDAERVMKPALQSARPAPRPKVVCGMTLIPADPSIDPNMIIPRRSDGLDYKIRAIDPPICNASK